ncbi:hypothetical protein SAMD00079811_03200 [Scytonema sp. HK-05]|uniref:hypothetical protein n=1 Tax=Scytonema sp. HK-05 TaxID=1137095 RepID=UPI0009F95D1C|nr:hypothetical protein [Scytonema sp. HK-05]BAY42742.1 hypothetical protein SAMD00079811_03200 [Scytonema sp. HK-05]
MISTETIYKPNQESDQGTQNFCFCTLAIGAKYRALAKDLAADLKQFSDNPLVILTDQPQDFNQYSNVQVFKHYQQSVACYHDKRYVIVKALSLYDACVFVDADMRILKDVMPVQWEPGISARSCAKILQHYQPLTGRPDRIKRVKLAKTIAQKFNLDLEKVNFVSEFMFAVAKDSGKEMKFLELWEKIGNYFELNGVYDSEGSVMGLAAAATEFPVQLDEMPKIEFFNDKIDAIRIRKGQIDPATRQLYFENYKQKAFQQRSLFEKVTSRIRKYVRHFYALIRLRVTTLKDFPFYYQDTYQDKDS